MIAHGLSYVAQASPHDPRDLVRKAAKALAIDGPTFLNVLAPCPRGWRSDGAETHRPGPRGREHLLLAAVRGRGRRVPPHLPAAPQAAADPVAQAPGPLRPPLQARQRGVAPQALEAWVDDEWEKLLRKCGEPSEAEWQEHLQANGCLLR